MGELDALMVFFERFLDRLPQCDGPCLEPDSDAVTISQRGAVAQTTAAAADCGDDLLMMTHDG